MRRLAAAVAAALAASVFLVSGTGSAPAAGHFPASWFGVVATDPTLLSSPAFFSQETAVMHSSGVQTVRFPVYWAQMQPDEHGPIQFANLDRMVGTAARNQLHVLPTVLSSPAWAALHPGSAGSSPPRNPSDYAAFVAALAKRYGPNGAFWKANPKLPALPIRIWQIWNEPNLHMFWAVHPYAPSYVALLKASHAAIKKVDPGAQIMLAGLPNRSWDALQAIYAAGGRPYFDIAAIHPYTHAPPDVLHIVAINRRVMAKNGDANKPISLTESGWCTDKYGTVNNITWNTNEAGQADNLNRMYAALARERNKLHVASVYWFTWYSPESKDTHNWADFSGLRHRLGTNVTSKPALTAYSKLAHKLEGQ